MVAQRIIVSAPDATFSNRVGMRDNTSFRAAIAKATATVANHALEFACDSACWSRGCEVSGEYLMKWRM